MFTGLIEEIGTIKQIQHRSRSMRLEIQAQKILTDLKIDDSVAVNGICLTAVEIGTNYFAVDAVAETLAKSSLKELRPSSKVNLERAMRLQDRLGGHLVQGHVDAVGSIHSFQHDAEGGLLDIDVPERLLRYIIHKGSITIAAVSLTVASKDGTTVSLAIIPHTLKQTTLQYKKVRDIVNIEVDLIAKYIEQLLPNSGNDSRLTMERLKEQGF